MVPNLVQRVGLARTGGKQAILKRADRRLIKRIEFVSHNGCASFPQLRTIREYHEPPAERGESFSKTSQRSSFGCACPTDSRRVMATRAAIRHGIGAKRNPILGRILLADISNGVVEVCSPKVA